MEWQVEASFIYLLSALCERFDSLDVPKEGNLGLPYLVLAKLDLMRWASTWKDSGRETMDW